MHLTLTLGWLYPDMTQIYGDHGNVLALRKQCEWLNIELQIRKFEYQESLRSIGDCDLLFMGGCQDRQQKLIHQDLFQYSDALINNIVEGMPGLFICGGYQLLGSYIQESDGEILKGLGLFKVYTIKDADLTHRLVGPLLIESTYGNLKGFENHLGRSFLHDKNEAFGLVISGEGNNGEDSTEGCVYNNCFGSYLHGPLLAQNPQFCFALIEKCIKRKYGDDFKLQSTKNWEIGSLCQV